ncbi:MAG: hypothetical protein ACTHK5_04155 [Tsuneonella sp.]
MPATVARAGRLIAAGAAIVAGAVLADSSMEHYRGSFENPGMWAPLAVSSLSLAANGVIGAGGVLGGAGMVGHAAAAATGGAGLGFHLYNVTRQVGGLRWGTLFYQAPLGAPAALLLAGALGAGGQALARGATHLGPVALGSGRALAGTAALGIAGTAAEAGLLHFRGAYHNPAMWLPVTLAPLSAAMLARAALTGRFAWITTAALAITAALGLAGSAFHAFGVSRNMGGWRNWRQNLLAGPPLPAPPAFAGLALAGLGALLLMRSRSRG